MRFARELRSAVEEGGGARLAHVVLSHVHADHVLGSMHFAPPARVIARAYTREKLSRWAMAPDLGGYGASYREMYPGAEEEVRELRIAVPDDVAESETAIDLGGGVTVRLHPVGGAAHTKGDLWALVEPDGVALCGDLWFNACEPYLASGSVAGALNAVGMLRS